MNKFNKVLKEEQDIINESRKHNARSGTPVDGDYVGLAFSGGGIRSATFNFGVLKALADLKILKHFDYLSTVSGGGYIGSWLTAYLQHHDHDMDFEHNIDDIITKACLETSCQPHDSMWFLRSYSNYLTPNLSMFGADTWTVFSTYLRNWILNLTLLFFFLTALLLGVHFLEISGIILVQKYNEYKTVAFILLLLSLCVAAYFAIIPLLKKTDCPANHPYIGIVFVAVAVLIGSFFILSFNKIDLVYGVMWSPPVLVIALMLGVVFYIGFRSKSPTMTEHKMEWFGRLGAWLLILIFVWSVAFLLAFYSPYLVDKIKEWGWTASLLWLLQTASGLFFAQSAQTAPSAGIKNNKMLDIFLKISPYIFIIGIFVIINILLVKIFYLYQENYFYSIFFNLKNMEQNNLAYSILTALAVAIVASLVLGFFLDINRLSIHYFYRNRLIRCYLGAARKKDERQAQSFTGFDEKDNIELRNLLKKDNNKEYINGPYPIINGTLNLVAGKELAWQQRKGASFIFSPKFCGYQLEEHCYQETSSYAQGAVTLGTALAVSGAAASPNSGYHSSPAMSFLMTVFNVRLGQWLPNSKIYQRRTRPMFPLWYLLLELFGRTNETCDFVYLSDGGHFENLGIYELVHRGCRFILASDAEQDGQFSFEGLGNAIEKCRIDLGVNISIDVEQIRPDANNKSKCHCAVATIEYSKNSQTDSHNKRIYPENDGILVYLKSSLTGDESTDVLHYSLQNPDFPHESTADQWFSESQFESYRQLGEHICKETFETFGSLDSTKSIEGIFIDLQNRWYPLPIGFDAFTKHTRTLDKLLERLRKDQDLAFLDAELCGEAWEKIVSGELGLTFPNSHHAHPANYSEFHNAFYFCNSLIQLMENVFLELNFEVDEYFKHPHNEGWRNLFKLWAKAPTVQKTWEINKLTYSKRFREFAEGKAMGINSPRS